MKIIKNEKSEFVRLREKYTDNFPLIKVVEDNLWIHEKYTFSDITYVRPKGDSKIGRMEVLLFNEEQEIQFFWIEVSFAHSENERIEFAKTPKAFSLTPEGEEVEIGELMTRHVVNKYSDITIQSVGLIDNNTALKINFFFKSDFMLDPEILSTQISLKNTKQFLEQEAQKELDEMSNNSLETFEAINQVSPRSQTNTMRNVNNFIISESFLSSPPPIVPGKTIVIPEEGVVLRKVIYSPPLSIDSRVAYLQVEYKKENSIRNERVAFEFPITIRQTAESLVHSIPISDFKYIGPSREVAPKTILGSFFTYLGDEDIDIYDIQFNKKKLDENSRYAHLYLLIKYRTAIVKIPMTLEFEMSRAEYKATRENIEKIENDSIEFSDNSLAPQNIFKLYKGDKNVIKEIIKLSKINDGYTYNSIKNLELVSFYPEARIIKFKVETLEILDKDKITHVFTKECLMKESYYEWKLNSLKAKDIEIDSNYLGDYPPQSLHEKTFKSTEEYAIQWIQYIPPKKDDKEVDVKIKVVTGDKTKIIIKKLVFKKTISEHLSKLQKEQIIRILKEIRPSDLTIDIDINGKPVKEIKPEDIIGVPPGIRCEVIYSRPELGEKSTRVVVKLINGIYSTGFEQTLIFAEPA